MTDLATIGTRQPYARDRDLIQFTHLFVLRIYIHVPTKVVSDGVEIRVALLDNAAAFIFPSFYRLPFDLCFVVVKTSCHRFFVIVLSLDVVSVVSLRFASLLNAFSLLTSLR